MNPRLFLFIVLAAGLAFGAPAAAPTTAKPPTQSERLRQRIDALLKSRLKPEPLPVILPNPFSVVTGGKNNLHADGSEQESPAEGEAETAPTATGARLAEELPVGSSTEALARGVAKLRIGGVVQLKGQMQIIINDSPRKEGDIIVLDRNNAMTYLQIVHIQPGMLTLRLNEATQTIRF
jgi:hypothetical protein